LRYALKRQGEKYGQYTLAQALPEPELQKKRHYDADKGGYREKAKVDEQTGYTKQQYANWARKYAKMYDVPLPLVLHVLNRETGHVDADTAASILGPKLKSGQRAVGVMQLNPGPEDIYLKDFGISRKDLTNPEKNIQAGVRLLAKHYNTYNQNPQYALMAYNWGPTAFKRWVDKGANLARLKKYNPETYEYVYGSKEKGWSSYEGDLNLQAQAYLGDDGAKTFLPKDNTSAGWDKTKEVVGKAVDTVTSKVKDVANATVDAVTPPSGTTSDVVDTKGKIINYLKDKYDQFKKDAMAKTAGADPAVLSGAGDTGELPDVTDPRSPGQPPEVKGGQFGIKLKRLLVKRLILLPVYQVK